MFIAGYLHKGAASGEVDFHQDLTYTDERVARAVILWVPLVDVEPSNGAIRAVRGSHTWTSGIRPGGGDWSPLDTLQTELLECSEPIPMSAGTALAWDPALIHGSSANDGVDSRPALAIGIVPQDADLLHFHRAHGGPTEGFAIADDFFVTVFRSVSVQRESPPSNLGRPTRDDRRVRRCPRGAASWGRRTRRVVEFAAGVTSGPSRRLVGRTAPTRWFRHRARDRRSGGASVAR